MHARTPLALATLFFTVSALAEPPSSMDPANARGQVELEHRHQRVARCSVERNHEVVSCKPTLEKADSKTSLTLRPLPDGKAISSTDKRREVPVNFETKIGTQSQSVELGVGTWELAWPGAKRLARFVVAPGDHFKIQLRTVSGRCEPKRAACVRLTTPRTRSISVPNAFRAP